MSLTKCNECGKYVSCYTKTCPNCGKSNNFFNMNSNKLKLFKILHDMDLDDDNGTEIENSNIAHNESDTELMGNKNVDSSISLLPITGERISNIKKAHRNLCDALKSVIIITSIAILLIMFLTMFIESYNKRILICGLFFSCIGISTLCYMINSYNKFNKIITKFSEVSFVIPSDINIDNTAVSECNITQNTTCIGNNIDSNNTFTKTENTNKSNNNFINNTTKKDTLIYGNIIEFDNLEITVGTEASFTTISEKYSSDDRKTVIKIPIKVKNLKDMPHYLKSYYYKVFGPDGTEIETFNYGYFDDSIDSKNGSLLPECSYTKNMYAEYTGDGKYSIVFSKNNIFEEEQPQIVNFFITKDN